MILDFNKPLPRPERKIRRISGLEFAEICPPVFAASKPSLPSAKLGLRYEKACVKRISRWFRDSEIFHNPWIKFLDENGPGFACPDIVVLGKRNFIFECKLSWNPLAIEQLCNLYLPLCERVFGVGFLLIVMTKNWRGIAPPPFEVIGHPNEGSFGPPKILLWSS